MGARFSFTEVRINGYWAIYDSKNEDDTIWIDCPYEFIEIIVNALNEKEHKV